MQAAPCPRLLVTAFQPFGAPGKPVRPENASDSVLRAFGDREGNRYDLLVLPVEPLAEVLLARALARDPVGVVSMGEAGLPGAWDTNVEEVARDLPVTAGGHPGAAAAGFRASPFARSIPLLPGMERADRIGAYWCNRAYYRVLEWCQLFHRPAVFLHLRVEGHRARQLRHLDHAVRFMEESLRGPPAGSRPAARGAYLARR